MRAAQPDGAGPVSRRDGAPASATSAANAPRARPDLAAAALSTANSSSVSENCTTLGRGLACRGRRLTDSAVLTLESFAAFPLAGGRARSQPCHGPPGVLAGEPHRLHCLCLDHAWSRHKQWM